MPLYFICSDPLDLSNLGPHGLMIHSVEDIMNDQIKHGSGSRQDEALYAELWELLQHEVTVSTGDFTDCMRKSCQDCSSILGQPLSKIIAAGVTVNILSGIHLCVDDNAFVVPVSRTLHSLCESKLTGVTGRIQCSRRASQISDS